jgi:hypothetical protein
MLGADVGYADIPHLPRTCMGFDALAILKSEGKHVDRDADGFELP